MKKTLEPRSPSYFKAPPLRSLLYFSAPEPNLSRPVFGPAFWTSVGVSPSPRRKSGAGGGSEKSSARIVRGAY
jgi:hypothetical protein